MEGAIADLSFYKTGDGYLVREKTDLGKKLKNHPAFQRTRENGAEFGRAAKAAKLFRDSIRTILVKTADARMHSRLHQLMVKVLQADSQSMRGERHPAKGNFSPLQDFQFNLYSGLNSTLYIPFTATINRATGNHLLEIAASEPYKQIVPPEGATHFKLVGAATTIDFAGNLFESKTAISDAKPINAASQEAVQLPLPLSANSVWPIFLVLGIEFHQLVNNNQYKLLNGAFNALGLVKWAGA